MKIWCIVGALLSLLGCQSPPNYATRQDYVEERVWDEKKH